MPGPPVVLEAVVVHPSHASVAMTSIETKVRICNVHITMLTGGKQAAYAAMSRRLGVRENGRQVWGGGVGLCWPSPDRLVMCLRGWEPSYLGELWQSWLIRRPLCSILESEGQGETEEAGKET